MTNNVPSLTRSAPDASNPDATGLKRSLGTRAFRRNSQIKITLAHPPIDRRRFVCFTTSGVRNDIICRLTFRQLRLTTLRKLCERLNKYQLRETSRVIKKLNDIIQELLTRVPAVVGENCLLKRQRRWKAHQC